MATGFTGIILRVDLSSGAIEKLSPGPQFYRTYLGGSAIGSYFLLKETAADLDPLDPANVLTIAPGVATGARLSGVSRCGVTALSPLTGMVGDSQIGGDLGPVIKRAGYDAIVITGRAPSLSYLLVEDSEITVRSAEHLAGKTVIEAYHALLEELGPRKLTILQCGPAGEKLVKFACLLADRNDAGGRTGMGCVFGSKNLRAVAVRGTGEVAFADPEGIRKLSKLSAQRLPGSGFTATLRAHGTPGLVTANAEAGNFATHNYSRGYHEDYARLEGANYAEENAAGQTTCYGCVVVCRKRFRADEPFAVSDELGGPEFENIGLLGSNLDVLDPVAVAKANEMCNNYGIDAITMGGIVGYVIESAEAGLIPQELLEGRTLRFGDPEVSLWLIERVAQRTGIGAILADSFVAAIDKFGDATRPFAVHVKNQGLAVHMPQVKPSLAIMYAACPIGPDHMSNEHDWLLASGSDASYALGILGHEPPDSTSLAKVRMTVYSQYYFSLLDTLPLCMFVWAPGNLHTYRELEDLIQYTTGWTTSLWELMKVGERRVNMMRQINARRGYTRADDCLPQRLFDPLPDGPSQGRHVDPDQFARMLDQYYALLGWDGETGNPTPGKLLELGLEWTLQ
ncbi:MAG: aldehyde ferredoxin oxidoreductase family protein [Pirellulales bacterium]